MVCHIFLKYPVQLKLYWSYKSTKTLKLLYKTFFVERNTRRNSRPYFIRLTIWKDEASAGSSRRLRKLLRDAIVVIATRLFLDDVCQCNRSSSDRLTQIRKIMLLLLLRYIGYDLYAKTFFVVLGLTIFRFLIFIIL